MVRHLRVGDPVVVVRADADRDPYIFQFQKSGVIVGTHADGRALVKLHSAWGEYPIPLDQLQLNLGMARS